MEKLGIYNDIIPNDITKMPFRNDFFDYTLAAKS